MSLSERFREIALPTSGGVSGSILSVNMCNIFDTLILAAVGAAVGILINEIWKYIKNKYNERKKKRNNREDKRTDTEIL